MDQMLGIISVLANVFGVLSGLYATYRIFRLAIRSYRRGKIFYWRQRRKIAKVREMLEELAEDNYVSEKFANLDEYIEELKIYQIRSAEENVRKEAINYSRHLPPNKKIDAALKDVICQEGDASKSIVILSMEVLLGRLQNIGTESS